MALNKGFAEKCVPVPNANTCPGPHCDVTVVSGNPGARSNNCSNCSISSLCLLCLVIVSLSFNVVTLVWAQRLQDQVNQLSKDITRIAAAHEYDDAALTSQDDHHAIEQAFVEQSQTWPPDSVSYIDLNENDVCFSTMYWYFTIFASN